jgi:dTDP-glucose pyrophosphorylase
VFYGIEAMAEAGIEQVGIIIAPETGPSLAMSSATAAY